MSGCGAWGEQLGAYLDGELAAAARTRLESHLPSCETCRSALDAQRWLSSALASLPPLEPSSQFEAGFWARLARAEAQTAPPRRTRWLRAPLIGGAAAAAALSLAVYLVRPGAGPEAEAEWVTAMAAEDFELALVSEPQLLEVLDVLESWDGS